MDEERSSLAVLTSRSPSSIEMMAGPVAEYEALLAPGAMVTRRSIGIKSPWCERIRVSENRSVAGA